MSERHVPPPLDYATPSERGRWRKMPVVLISLGIFLGVLIYSQLLEVNIPRQRQLRALGAAMRAASLHTSASAIISYQSQYGGAFPTSLADPSIIYPGSSLTDKTVTSDMVIAYVPPTSDDGGRMNVLFGDWHVEWVDKTITARIIAAAQTGKHVTVKLGMVAMTQVAATPQPAGK